MSLLIILMLGGYGYGAWKFWQGFDRTTFGNGKVGLTVLWPLLVATNKNYRQNFSKALKGR